MINRQVSADLAPPKPVSFKLAEGSTAGLRKSGPAERL